MLRIHVLTCFPEILTSPLQESILKRAQEKGLVRVEVHDLRQFATDRHRTTDDDPYGGGPGMIMKAEPLVHGLEQLRAEIPGPVYDFDLPSGTSIYVSERARELASKDALLFICGRYGGVDDRVRAYVDEELSIGDYVLTGGELATLVMVDAIIRLRPGVLGNEASIQDDSFAEALLGCPAIHASTGVSGTPGSRRPAFRQSSADPPLAAARSAQTYTPTPTGPAPGRCAQSRRSHLASGNSATHTQPWSWP